MLDYFGTVIPENVQMTIWIYVAQDTMSKPPWFPNPKFKTSTFERRNVRRLIIWISDNQVNLDNRLGGETFN